MDAGQANQLVELRLTPHYIKTHPLDRPSHQRLSLRLFHGEAGIRSPATFRRSGVRHARVALRGGTAQYEILRCCCGGPSGYSALPPHPASPPTRRPQHHSMSSTARNRLHALHDQESRLHCATHNRRRTAMRVIVIGGTGTIGTAVVKLLSTRHDVVTVGHTRDVFTSIWPRRIPSPAFCSKQSAPVMPW